MTYTYQCTNHKKPRLAYTVRSIHEDEIKPTCFKCGQEMQRVFDAPPAHWMGTGWANKNN